MQAGNWGGCLIGRYYLMGKASRRRPARLAEKLLQIRTTLGLSQNEMLRRLEFDEAYRNYISDFENNKREPDYLTLLSYARSYGISTDILIDDNLDLPLKPIRRNPAP
jgi:transcriptional regulator with XRE-family HTH domain